MGSLQFQAHNAHTVRVDGRRVLFHIPTTALFELDELSAAVYDLFAEQGTVSAAEVRERFDGRYPPHEIVGTLQDMLDLQVVGDVHAEAPRQALKIDNYPLSTVVLNVNTGCNLGCSYCYKEDLAIPARGEKMDFATARRSIDLLLREGDSRERLSVVFFGGEPLSNLPLIRQVVDYAEQRGAGAGKTIDFSLTTNATLLTEATIDYLDQHRFGLSVSIDGPRAIHDRHRRTVGGKGTYSLVERKVRMLLERYRSRPVGARVTVTSGAIDVVAIHRHLIDELGFFEAGYAPVTADDHAGYGLSGEELTQFFVNMKALGEDYCAVALAGSNNGFGNLHQLMTDLHQGSRKTLPCGAGVGLLAVDKAGDLNLCHRFTGSDHPTYGNVEQGIDKARLGAFLEAAADRSGTACETCRIRHLCAGGCYHESYARYADPLSPTYSYCDLMRDWVDFGIGVYHRIQSENPDFFARHIAPRSLTHETFASA